MLTTASVERLNQQINLEQYSSNLYMQMSAWCDHQGYTGCAAFLREHALEELQHMYKLFDYVCETGAQAQLAAVAAPPATYDSLAEVFRLIYEHELMITRSINKLVAAALAEELAATVTDALPSEPLMVTAPPATRLVAAAFEAMALAVLPIVRSPRLLPAEAALEPIR